MKFSLSVDLGGTIRNGQDVFDAIVRSLEGNPEDNLTLPGASGMIYDEHGKPIGSWKVG